MCCTNTLNLKIGMLSDEQLLFSYIIHHNDYVLQHKKEIIIVSITMASFILVCIFISLIVCCRKKKQARLQLNQDVAQLKSDQEKVYLAELHQNNDHCVNGPKIKSDKQLQIPIRKGLRRHTLSVVSYSMNNSFYNPNRLSKNKQDADNMEEIDITVADNTNNCIIETA